MKVTAATFSPTGNSRRYATELARCFSPAVEEWDLSIPANRAQTVTFGPGELVVLAAPVYGGRIPTIPGGIFTNLKGQKTPAIVLVTYGNREYEDSLLELKNLAEENGFVVLGAGAFVGPHTFAPVAGAGRPDEADLAAVRELAQNVQAVMGHTEGKTLDVPGNFPYKAEFVMPMKPSANEKCIRCGRCARECPVGAISPEEPQKTDPALCIDCFRCVRQCPVGARNIYSPPFAGIVSQLEAGLTRFAKPAAIFWMK